MYLNCHSYYSFKYGMMSPEQLLAEANRLGIESIALTDINNTSGIIDFFRIARRYNIKPIAGIDFRNGTKQQFIAIAKNLNGFKEMNSFLSIHLQGKEEFSDRAPEFNDAFVIYPSGNAPEKLRSNEYIGINMADFNKLPFSTLRYLYNKHVILHPVTFLKKDTREINGSRITFRREHLHEAHRLLRAIDNNTIITKINPDDLADQNEIMLSGEAIRQLYSDYPVAIKNTIRLQEESRTCGIDFEFGQNKNKKIFSKSVSEDRERLIKECEKGMQYRYPNSDQKIIDRYNKEIDMITDMGFTAYFLINWDIINYARHKGFFYIGRGSGANSMVAYLLNITDVDPIDLDLYFERFINPSRKNPPDFDIDFSSSERDEIIKYIFKKHGTEHTALLATYSTLQDNAVMRELGKVYGLPKNEIDSLPDLKVERKSQFDLITKKILAFGNYLKDFPVHLSVHAGGILISEKHIHHYTATVLPPKDFPLTQFSMLEAEDVGLYKFDILAQRGLGKIKDAVEIVKLNRGKEEDIHDIKRFKEDNAIQKNLESADLMGCFYVESPAMRMLLSKLKAKTYLDLVAASSIIRPGVAQSGMMREYILRFHDPARRIYPNKLMEDILGETFGVMVYQEDVIKVAHLFGGLSLEESDKLRRGMGGKYRGREEFANVKDNFFTGCRNQNYDEKLIAEVWRQMESFGGYAFAKGHSASYAVESYQCMFLKTYYPLEFLVAVINNGGGFYRTEFYVHEARMKGAAIHAPDINKSELLTTIYGTDIYLGLNLLLDLKGNTIEAVLKERSERGEFKSLQDFFQRTAITAEQLTILIRIGAFRFTGRSKKQLLWDMYAFFGGKKKSEPEHELFVADKKQYKLPQLEHHRHEDAMDEIEILGFPLCSPFELIKEEAVRQPDESVLRRATELTAVGLPLHLGKVVSILGYLVTVKNTHTIHGDNMGFGTFLDHEGKFIDTTHFPNTMKRFPFQGRGCYLIKGKVVAEFGFYSLEVSEMSRVDMITRNDLVEA